LLRSHPGGFSGAGCVGLAGAKIGINYKFKNIIKEKYFENSLLKLKH